MRTQARWRVMRASHSAFVTRAQVSIPAPDPALPPSFDSDSSGHHYRFLESANQARVTVLRVLWVLAAHARSLRGPHSGWCARSWMLTAGTMRAASRGFRSTKRF